MPVNPLQLRIEKIKQELYKIGDMRPGSLSEQFNVCGKAGCRCKHPDTPKRHGPYMQLSYTHKGRSYTEFVRKDRVEEIRQQIENYSRFRALTNEWIELSIEMGRKKSKTAHKNPAKGATKNG